jgi:hypothetical protein
MLAGYDKMERKLGKAGAPQHAAQEMVACLRQRLASHASPS